MPVNTAIGELPMAGGGDHHVKSPAAMPQIVQTLPYICNAHILHGLTDSERPTCPMFVTAGMFTDFLKLPECH